MGALIPASVINTPLHPVLVKAGLKRIHQGKVRDTHQLSDGLLLVVASNRISIFDFVLPATIPHKGEILTAMTVFWLQGALSDTPHHLVAFGHQIDEYLPPSLRGNKALQRCALVVEQLSMIPKECIARGYLAGSGWTAYQAQGHICGVTLPPGLKNGSRLAQPIFTPTTKAEAGHDQHESASAVVKQYGQWIEDLTIACYKAMSIVAARSGLAMADTKFEFGQNRKVGDEVGTPDSSRFWDLHDWERALKRGLVPEPRDKELVRNWGKLVALRHPRNGKTTGIQNLNPQYPTDLEFVNRLDVPTPIIRETERRYRDVFLRLTGKTLERYQETVLGA